MRIPLEMRHARPSVPAVWTLTHRPLDARARPAPVDANARRRAGDRAARIRHAVAAGGGEPRRDGALDVRPRCHHRPRRRDRHRPALRARRDDHERELADDRGGVSRSVRARPRRQSQADGRVDPQDDVHASARDDAPVPRRHGRVAVPRRAADHAPPCLAKLGPRCSHWPASAVAHSTTQRRAPQWHARSSGPTRSSRSSSRSC